MQIDLDNKEQLEKLKEVAHLRRPTFSKQSYDEVVEDINNEVISKYLK